MFFLCFVFSFPLCQPKLDKIVPELEEKEKEQKKAKKKEIMAANALATEQFAKRLKKQRRSVASR